MIEVNQFLKQYNSFKTDLEGSVFNTSFFKNSWISSSNLNNKKLEQLIENIHRKDLDQDKNANKPKFILLHHIKNKEIYLIEIEKFLILNDETKLNWYNNFIDFYIPRSIWFRSFCLLQKNLSEDIKQ